MMNQLKNKNQVQRDAEKVQSLSPRQVAEKWQADFPINIWELALKFNAPCQTIRAWQAEGMPFFKQGRRTLFTPSKCDQWINSNRKQVA